MDLSKERLMYGDASVTLMTHSCIYSIVYKTLALQIDMMRNPKFQ